MSFIAKVVFKGKKSDSVIMSNRFPLWKSAIGWLREHIELTDMEILDFVENDTLTKGLITLMIIKDEK